MYTNVILRRLMKILVIVPHYPPEIGSAAHLYHDLVNSISSRDHEVTVLTSCPRGYNLTDNGSRVSEHEVNNGVEIVRCKIASKRDVLLIRGMEHFLMPIMFYRQFLKMRKKFDVALIYIPPLPLAFLGIALSKIHDIRVVGNFQDFHPQELIEGGLMSSNGLMVRTYEWMEKTAYDELDYITVLSEGGLEYIRARSHRDSNMEHIFNSTDIIEIDGYGQKRDFKEKNGLESSFLITYLGILSPFQGLDIILDVAKQIDAPDVVFVIAGDGIQKRHLFERVERESIKNVLMLEMQPRDEYYNILKSSDVSLIVLDSRMKAPLIPGKTVNIMACGIPVLAIVPKESETANVILEADCGLISEPDDNVGIVENIKILKNDAALRQRMGINGKQFVNSLMNLERNTELYERIFKELEKNKR